ncbi:UNVERIFIED_CONTAM: hypothetical protein Slati_3498500 [Sesamum latifolium]|uniref:DUF4283 domain-containing protein n=1 Tax=Sesamum latifolium TaxID=2727402 RepID=A0AAW2UMT5_9LAMI
MGGVDPDVERLKKAWKLTDDEDDPMLLPSGLWCGQAESHKLCLVGRLLSNRPYRFEALCSSIQSMLLSIKGMDIQQLQDGRFLLRFNNIIDKQRALEGCPWSFEKNILILGEIGESENPMHVDLDLCDFHVHIHDLPLNMVNLGVATLIGNRLGVFRDMDADDVGCSWGGATVRIWVGLNVTRPLKRVLKLMSLIGDELLVRFTSSAYLTFVINMGY